jgi:hypothetical protein
MKIILPLFLLCFCLFLICGLDSKYSLYKTYALNNTQRVRVLNVNEACEKKKKSRSSGITFNVEEISTSMQYSVISTARNCCDKIVNNTIINVLIPESEDESAIYGDISIKSEFYGLLSLIIIALPYTIYESIKLMK